MTIIIEEGVIKGATVPSILDHLIKGNADSDIMDKFFAAFPQFMEAKQVWNVFSQNEVSPDQWLETPAENLSWTIYPSATPTSNSPTDQPVAAPQQVQPVKPRTQKDSLLSFLWGWISRSFYRDFISTKKRRRELFEELLKFLGKVHIDLANRFKLLMIKCAHERKRKSRQIKLKTGGSGTPTRAGSMIGLGGSMNGNPVAPPSPGPAQNVNLAIRSLRDLDLGGLGGLGAGPAPTSPAPVVPTKKVLEPGKFEFIDLDPTDVAQQLTLIEFDIFRDIQESELFKLCWRNENPNRTKISPNVVKLVDRFNTVSFWVATEIVMVTSQKDRISVLRKFIQVAEILREMNNFNGVMEIIGGINMWAVTRLKLTWEALPQRSHTIVEELNTLMENKKNYGNYRTALKSAKLPIMPYLGVYLRDLTFIEEGNPDYLGDKSKGVFNFEKLQLIGALVTEIKKFQSVDYQIERNEVLMEYLNKLLTLPDEMLIKHSQLCEPSHRDST